MKTYEERYSDIVHKASNQLRNRRRILSVSCAGAVVTALLLILFIPFRTTPNSVRQYRSNPYFSVIEKINPLTFEMPKYKNNYEVLRQKLYYVLHPSEWDPWAGIAGDPGNSSEGAFSPSDINGSYVEVTDNQVADVIEPDTFKRTDKYLFHLLQNSTLYIYSIEQESSAEVARVDLRKAVFQQFLHSEEFGGCKAEALFLSDDGRTATVLMSCYIRKSDFVVVANFDITDVNNIQLDRQYMVSGTYSSTRMVDGSLLICTNYQFRSNSVDFENNTTYVPQAGWLDAMESIAAEDIVVPDTVDSCRYRVYCLLDADTLAPLDHKALLGYPDAMFVSGSNIYSSYFYTLNDDKGVPGYFSDITAISYADQKLQVLSTLTVDGGVLNQYSMDEYNGSFRVVTSTYRAERRVLSNGNVRYNRQTDSANLYCFDTATWALTGMVEHFTPQGEEVTSVRYKENMAYVCTVERNLSTGEFGGDPVFFFDLSDPTNITWTDTGIIDGFSTSLVDFGDGFLLGIGFNEEGDLKIEIYREELGRVVSVCSYERACYFSSSYKSYYIDREKQMIGLGIRDRDGKGTQYVLIRYENGKLIPVMELPVQTNVGDIRSTCIDGWLYVLSDGLQVMNTEEYGRSVLKCTVIGVYDLFLLVEDGENVIYEIPLAYLEEGYDILFNLGDVLLVSYRGAIQESYPNRIPGTYKIELLY